MQLSLMVRLSPSSSTQSAARFLVGVVLVLCFVLDPLCGWVFFSLDGKKGISGSSEVHVHLFQCPCNAAKFLHLRYLQRKYLCWVVVSFD